MNYRKWHMVDSEEDELPAKEMCRITTWMQFLQTFSTTEGRRVFSVQTQMD